VTRSSRHTSSPAPSAARDFAAALGELERELDWSSLEPLYCEGEANGFFSLRRRDTFIDSGLRIAGELADALAALAPAAPARSLYVGAALAELPLILCERFILGREVRWHNLAGAESAELNRSLAAVEERLALELPRVDTRDAGVVEPRSCSHVWMVSVLTDPDRFPALHDALYEKSGDQASGRGDLASERARAERLLEQALERLAAPGLFSTTDEELQLALPAGVRMGLVIRVPAEGAITPIVGDRVRFCRAEPHAARLVREGRASVQGRPSGAFAAEDVREIPRPDRPQTADPPAEFK
jgi:hypothetical protein